MQTETRTSDSFLWTERIIFIHNGRRQRNGIKELRSSNEKNQHVDAHESVHACAGGSTKPGSENETREMPSEPEAWVGRHHIMHRQQRGSRCNTLMNKYAEGWN